MLLIFAETFVDVGIVVENLYFHALVGGIYAHRGAYAHAIVHALAKEGKFEAEHEVAILLHGVEVALVAIVGSHVDASIDGHVSHLIACPLVQVGAIEENLKSLLLLLIRECEDG